MQLCLAAVAAWQFQVETQVRKLGRVMMDVAPGVMHALLHVRDAHLAKLLRSAELGQATTATRFQLAPICGSFLKHAI